MRWTFENIPDQSGRTAIVTGANTGIGFETARQLALKGCHVILATRTEEKGLMAAQRIVAEYRKASVEVVALDLSSLTSVELFAEAVKAEHWNVDLLINNAGVMAPPMSVTDDGFELQIGVNFLGHFALTGRLLSLIEHSKAGRVVTVSSLAHKMGEIDLDSFRGEKRYRRWTFYGQSKLAGLMFSLELQRRLELLGSSVVSVAAHPGWTKTELQRHDRFSAWVTSLLGMPAWQGALTTLRAATDPEVQGGEYFGPDGFGEISGYPAPARISKSARNLYVAEELWAEAEEATGVTFPDVLREAWPSSRLNRLATV